MSRATRTRTVVFDLDGTLVDSLPLVLRAIAHAIEPFGPVPPTMEIFARLGGPPERFLLPLVGDARHVPVAVERLEKFHRENFQLIQPFDGLHAFLGRLRAAGVELAIWTGRDRASSEPLLRDHRLADFFPTMLCGDDLPTHKPDPAGLREIMRRIGATAGETVFVGDADVDVLGGAGCGVDTVLIRHQRNIPAEIGRQAWRTVESPGEAFELVLGCVERPADRTGDS